MNQKTWLWKKRSIDKTITASDKVKLSLGGNEIQTPLKGKAELESDLTILNEKLSSALIERNTKDDFAKQQAKVAQEAIAGWEKAEAEAISLKQELEKAITQRVAGEERLISMDAALKECMQQLRFVREEQEKRIHDAMMKTSREFEKMIIVLEDKLAETSKRLAMLGAQNTQLSKALLEKEKVTKDLQEHRARSEANFSTLMTRLESTEKENASLKYEVRVVEKELEIRNEEREFNRRAAEVVHKQHLESVKKIAKLESECQRLRLLVRKRLPGPAALAKMKNEVEMLARDPAERRRRKSISSTGSMDFAVNAPDTPTKRFNFLAEQLYTMEEENRTLKEALIGKTNALQLLKNTCGSTASRFPEVETQLEESSKSQIAVGLAGNLPTMQELSLASISDVGSDEKFSCADSLASALNSELEQKNGTLLFKTVGASDINLMEDFIEMEKLAIVTSDKSFGSSSLASERGKMISGLLDAQSGGYISETTDAEIVIVSKCQCHLSVPNQGIQSENMLINKIPVWVDDIVKVVLEQTQVSQRNPDEILEIVKVALALTNPPIGSESVTRESLIHPDVKGCISLKPSDKSSIMVSPDRLIVANTSLAEKRNQQFHSDLSKSVLKMIELLDGISLPSPHYGTPEILNGKDDSSFSETPTGYMVRVFQWKTSDLSAVLQKFFQICNDLLNGKADLAKFAEEITSALEWIMNHCFSLQDVSSMRDAIKKHFDWDESRSESEIEGAMINHFTESDKLHIPVVSDWKCRNSFLQMEELWSSLREESIKLKDDLANTECGKKELEGRLESEISKNESLMNQLQESEKTIESLQVEVEILSQSKRINEDQFENLKMVKEDPNTQLAAAKAELNKASENLSFLEEELDSKNISCEELEATCLDLQLQLESMTKKEILKYNQENEKKQLQNNLEITTASEKLAECQETILNLGRQLQAMASPRDASLFDKVICTPTAITTVNNPKKNKTTLLDKMLAEENAETGYPRSPKTKEIICTSKSPTVVDGTSRSAFRLNCATDSPESFQNSNGNKHQEGQVIVNSLAIIPGKRKGSGGLWKKILWRRNKANSKKPFFQYAA